MKYLLPELEYAYNALEPFIDAKTMEIHHTKHHQAYINNLNTVLAKYSKYSDQLVEELLRNLGEVIMEEKDKKFFINNAGGTINHSFFWKIMGTEKEINENLRDEIIKEFGSVDSFKKMFTETAVKHFGSGWAWLVKDRKGDLMVYSLPNQDSPLSLGHIPLLTLDVWEHSYYLKYQNRRAEYIEAWWNVVKII